jgi:hypothetical protein
MLSLNDLKDKTIGKIGTVTRDLYEEKLKKDLKDKTIGKIGTVTRDLYEEKLKKDE